MVRIKAEFAPDFGLTPPMAAKLSNAAEQFESEISLEFQGKSMRMDSLIGLISIAFHQGEVIHVVANGEDEDAAAHSIRSILEDAAF